MTHLLVVDLVLYNGSVHTLDDEQPIVSAVAIAGNRIAAVGTNEDMLALASERTQRIDLQGRVVIPGLTDAHVHWWLYSRMLQNIACYSQPNRAAIVEMVRQRVQVTPPGQWVLGQGWLQDDWDDKSFPTAADLDAVSPDHPVYLVARSCHAGWANSAALRAAGITRATPDPEGSEIARDAHGDATGLLLEIGAMKLIEAAIPTPTPEQMADAMLAAQQVALSRGVTAIHDYDDPNVLAALQVLRERGQLAIRVLKHINKPFLDAALASGLRHGFGDDWLRIGHLKMFADGAIGPHTAWMLEPYLGEPDNFGMPTLTKEDMMACAERATLSGLPTTIHAIGDRAVREVLDVFEHVRAVEARHGIPRDQRRHRVEHVQIISPQDVYRLAELDLIASMQPSHATTDYPVADRVWGHPRLALAYNPRAQIDRGVVVAFGSDAPVDDFDPFLGMYAAVARRRLDGSPSPEGWLPEGKVTLDEALRGYTFGGAYAASMDDRKGRLRAGYLADLVVLNRDIFAEPADALKDVRVLLTMVDGVVRYSAS
ncbi:MAG: amidohydrolase [Pleurocapsa minor GSE-CHR-MK-17-07R]|jgi:predicted amidohydrolase YtcJ|nr:amidohydrolase [Pleurocapsa minor GSE-CHR-MK 17-07R]